MRITPIMANNHYSPTKKISFGMIENKKTEEITNQMMMKEVEWYDEEDKQDPDMGYKEAVAYIKEKLDYFKASRLFTLKSKKNAENEDVLYVTMNKEEVDKHKHKDLLNEMIKDYQDFYDPSKQDPESYNMEEAQKAGLPGEEKGFLRILFGDSSVEDFYNDMHLREQGKRPEPPKPYTPSGSDSSILKTYKQEHQERVDFAVYGTLF